MSRALNVLFLCTGNSARSILGEALLNHRGAGRFKAYSAGSFPKGAVHPCALAVLAEMGVPTHGLRSKSWNEFAQAGSPRMDCILTVCDNAAGEVCPVWPGQPVTAHWGLEDPAAFSGPHERQLEAFRETARLLTLRFDALLRLGADELSGADAWRRLAGAGAAVPRVPS